MTFLPSYLRSVLISPARDRENPFSLDIPFGLDGRSGDGLAPIGTCFAMLSITAVSPLPPVCWGIRSRACARPCSGSRPTWDYVCWNGPRGGCVDRGGQVGLSSGRAAVCRAARRPQRVHGRVWHRRRDLCASHPRMNLAPIVGPVACALMARYQPRFRIDVEHEIVDPIAGNYDIVFAMLEAPVKPSAIVIRKVFSIARGLFAAPSLLESRGEPRTLGDLAGFPLLAGPIDAEWTLPTATARFSILPPRAPGWSVRMPASGCRRRWPDAASWACRRASPGGGGDRSAAPLLPDYACESLNVHALLPARRLMPEKVRCFLDAMEEHARIAGPADSAPLAGARTA